MLVVKTTKNAAAYLDLTDHETEQMHAVAALFSKETLIYHCKLLENALLEMQRANAVKRILAEMTLVRMCDEALDSSAEALLSRIARLEEQVMMGVPAAVKSVSEPSAVEKPTERETVKIAPKAPVTSKPSAPATPVGEAKRVLRPIRNWMEVAERISRSRPMEAGFVKMAKAYTTEDGAVIVRVDNVFGLQVLEKDEARDCLRMAISAVLRREVGDRQLAIEAVPKEAERSLIDEIIEDNE
jgi:DNA polymerase III gamma/tau subunit